GGLSGTFSTQPVPQVAPVVKITTAHPTSDIWVIDKDTDVQALVTDANHDLDSYTLKAYPFGATGTGDMSDSNGILIAEGTSEIGSEPANGVTIGGLHPTLLADGLYKLVLSAKDGEGHASSDEVLFRVDGQLKLGNFTLPVTDLSLNLA